MSVQKRTLFDFCADRDPFSLSRLRAGLRKGAAVSRGDVVRYLSRNHSPVSALPIVKHYIETLRSELWTCNSQL